MHEENQATSVDMRPRACRAHVGRLCEGGGGSQAQAGAEYWLSDYTSGHVAGMGHHEMAPHTAPLTNHAAGIKQSNMEHTGTRKKGSCSPTKVVPAHGLTDKASRCAR